MYSLIVIATNGIAEASLQRRFCVKMINISLQKVRLPKNNITSQSEEPLVVIHIDLIDVQKLPPYGAPEVEQQMNSYLFGNQYEGKNNNNHDVLSMHCKPTDNQERAK